MNNYNEDIYLRMANSPAGLNQKMYPSHSDLCKYVTRYAYICRNRISMIEHFRVLGTINIFDMFADYPRKFRYSRTER